MRNGYFDDFYDDSLRDEDALRDEELEEAERMIRNGLSTRRIARKQFTYLGQSDIFKLRRKYGLGDEDQDSDMWQPF